MKKFIKNNKFAVIAIACLLVVGVVSGSWAYFKNGTTFQNDFYVKPYGNDFFEVFESPDDWKPNETIEKKLYAQNTEFGDIIVRASVVSETWFKDGVDVTDQYYMVRDSKGVNSATEKAAQINYGEFVKDSKTGNTGAYWLKGDASGNKSPIDEDYYWYYYQKPLAGVPEGGSIGEETKNFIDSVTLSSNAYIGTVAVDASGKTFGDDGYDSTCWKENSDEAGNKTFEYIGYKDPSDPTGNTRIKKYVSDPKGYGGLTYTLTVQIQSLVSSEKAVKDTGWSTSACDFLK